MINQTKDESGELYQIIFSTYEPFAALHFGGYYLPFIAQPGSTVGQFAYNPLVIFKSEEELLAYWAQEAAIFEQFKQQAARQLVIPNGQKVRRA